MVREVLVHRVPVGVVIHIVPAQQHTPRRASVNEDDGGLLVPSRPFIKLAIDLYAILGGDHYFLRYDNLGCRKISRDPVFGYRGWLPALDADHHWKRRRLGACAYEGDAAAIARNHGRPLDSFARG